MADKFDLEECRQILKLSPKKVAERLDVEPGDGQKGSYEGLAGVTQYYNKAAFPGRVYVSDDRVEMVYVPAGAALEDVTVSALKKDLKGESKALRSRAGKEYTHTVYPEEGVAFSAGGGEVVILEVFPPRNLKDYEKDIYRDPGQFIR